MKEKLYIYTQIDKMYFTNLSHFAFNLKFDAIFKASWALPFKRNKVHALCQLKDLGFVDSKINL